MLQLPIDIIKIIISYTYNIDLRRQYNIYQKIKLNNFDKINTVIRILKEYHLVYSFEPNKIKYNYQYHLINSEENDNRFEEHVDNDMFYVEIIVDCETINYNIEIFKLKLKPHPDYTNPYDIFYKGNLTSQYYWETTKINYLVN